ncbi:MAG TPA: hypothetical protein VJP02_25450 [Candidatus Sulfotelmatobacter sp.]|nr:hypothetical protein [Candidatus Sulfotelmatobacter sp.]
MTNNTSRILGFAVAASLMALAANCFLKYLWWTACYSAWYGVPKLAEQWKLAGSNASFNGWSFIAFEAATIALLFCLIRLRSIERSGFFRNGARLVLSLTFSIAGTGAFALALSWFKQAH